MGGASYLTIYYLRFEPFMKLGRKTDVLARRMVKGKNLIYDAGCLSFPQTSYNDVQKENWVSCL